jgi:hypothetical protein
MTIRPCILAWCYVSRSWWCDYFILGLELHCLCNPYHHILQFKYLHCLLTSLPLNLTLFNLTPFICRPIQACLELFTFCSTWSSLPIHNFAIATSMACTDVKSRCVHRCNKFWWNLLFFSFLRTWTVVASQTIHARAADQDVALNKLLSILDVRYIFSLCEQYHDWWLGGFVNQNLADFCLVIAVDFGERHYEGRC